MKPKVCEFARLYYAYRTRVSKIIPKYLDVFCIEMGLSYLYRYVGWISEFVFV